MKFCHDCRSLHGPECTRPKPIAPQHPTPEELREAHEYGRKVRGEWLMEDNVRTALATDETEEK